MNQIIAASTRISAVRGKYRGALGLEQAHADPRHAEAECHRPGGEQDALGEEVAQQTSARCTERRPDGEIGLPARHACDQEVRCVGAGDQPHEPDGREREPGHACRQRRARLVLRSSMFHVDASS